MKGPGKGHTNNPAGKPKGAGNLVVAQIREQLRDGVLADDIVSSLLVDVGLIVDAYKRAQMKLNILDMVLPRLATEVTPEQTEAAIVNLYDMFQKYPAKTG